VTDNLEGGVKKVQALTSGGIPVLVYPVPGGIPMLASISGFQATLNSVGQIDHVENLTINYFPQTKITSTTTINNIHDILTQIDNSNYPQQEKDEIKEAVSQIDKAISSLGKIADKATPFIYLVTSLIEKLGK
jgi:hypothetical protein